MAEKEKKKGGGVGNLMGHIRTCERTTATTGTIFYRCTWTCYVFLLPILLDHSYQQKRGSKGKVENNEDLFFVVWTPPPLPAFISFFFLFLSNVSPCPGLPCPAKKRTQKHTSSMRLAAFLDDGQG
jgi:hypothetical protein